jgi:uncharacterized protein
MTPWFESFVFGVANSVHCACMCGPLAVAFASGAGPTLSYHGARTASYGALGVVLGGFGSALGADELRTPAAWVAFVLAAGIVVLLVFGHRGTVPLPSLQRLVQVFVSSTRRRPPWQRTALLGLATPLLPCGLLWAACGGAVVAGSATAGLVVMAGFAVGTVPLLLLAQLHADWLTRRLGARGLRCLQSSALVLAAATLLWRGVVSLDGASCCH